MTRKICGQQLLCRLLAPSNRQRERGASLSWGTQLSETPGPASRVTTSFRAVGKVPAGRAGRAAPPARPSRPGAGYGRRAGAAEPGPGGGRARPGGCTARPRLPQGGSRHGGWKAPSSPGPLRDAHGHPRGRRRRRRRRRKDAGHRARDLFTPPGS